MIAPLVLVCQGLIFCVILLQGSSKNKERYIFQQHQINLVLLNWEKQRDNFIQFVKNVDKNDMTPLQTVDLTYAWSFFQQEHNFLFLFIRILYRYQFRLRVLLVYFEYPGTLLTSSSYKILIYKFISFRVITFCVLDFFLKIFQQVSLQPEILKVSWILFYKKLTTLDGSLCQEELPCHLKIV